MVPSVSSYISNSRKTAYAAHEKSMEEAAKSMTIEVINGKDNFALPKTGDHAEVFLNELVDKEYLESLKDPATGDLCNESMSYVIIKNTGSSDYGYKSCLYCGSYITEGDECSTPPVDDNEKPVCGMITGESSEWTNKSRTITIACSDAGSGCTRNKFSKTFNATATKGFIQISDKSGKTENCEVNVRVDKTEPTCELIVEGDENVESTGWSSGRTVVVKFKEGSRKDEHSGISTYGIGTSLKNRNYNKQESYAIENISGTTTVIGYVKDNAGNEGTCYKTVITGLEKPKFAIRYGYQVYPLKERFNLTNAEQVDSTKIKTTSANSTIEFNHMGIYQNVTAVIIELRSAITDPSSFKLTVNGNTYSGSSDNASNTRIRFFIETEPELNDVTSDKYTIRLGSEPNVTYDISKIEFEKKVGNLISKYNVAVNLLTRKQVVKTTNWSWDDGAHWDTKYYKLFDSTTGAKTGYAVIKNDIPLTSDHEQYQVQQGDNTNPTITITPSTTYWTNQDVTLTGKAQDTGAGIIAYAWSTSSTINYYSGPWEYYDTATTAEKTYTYVVKTNGTYYLHVKDNAGNVVTESIKITVIDRDPPTCTNSGDSTTWINTKRTIKFGCADTYSGCNPSYSGGSSDFTSTTKTSTIASYVIKDLAGNSTTCPARTANIYVDTTNPQCTNSGDSTTWQNTKRTIYYGCSDANSGCKTGYSGSSREFTSTIQTSTIAAYTIKDNAGNTVDCPSRTANVYVDTTAPSCTNSGDSTTWQKTSRTIYYGCSDANSGCSTSYSGSSNTYSTTTTTASIAAYTIKDNAGNTVNCPARTANVYVDTTAPSCTNSGDSTTWQKTSRTIYYGCSDANSGCNTSYSGSSNTYSTTTTTASIAAYTIIDNAGNSTNCPARTANVYVDTTAPTCSTSKPSTGGTDGVSVSISCSDSDSGCSSSNTTSETGVKHNKTYTVSDNAGNTGTCPVSVEKYDCNPHNCRCSSCYYGSNTCKYGCAPGYYSKPGSNCDSCDSAGTADCWYVDAEGNAYGNHPESCTYHKGACSNCYTGSNTCRYGCDTCYDDCYR